MSGSEDEHVLLSIQHSQLDDRRIIVRSTKKQLIHFMTLMVGICMLMLIFLVAVMVPKHDVFTWKYNADDCKQTELCQHMENFLKPRKLFTDVTGDVRKNGMMQSQLHNKNIQMGHQVMSTAIGYNDILRHIRPDTPIAILVEGRHAKWDLDSLQYVLENAIETIPKEWRIHVYVSDKAVEYLTTSVFFYTYSHLTSKIVMHVMPPNMKLNKHLYNRLISQKVLWDAHTPASHIHLIEQDTGYCKNSDMKIAEYLQYDYCGAMWPNVPCEDQVSCVGNSGFSIWRRSVMSDLTGRFTMPEELMENGSPYLIDEYWGGKMRENSANLCPKKQAEFFSTESVHNTDITPIGWHKPYYDAWNRETQQHFDSVCPSYRRITRHEL